jgi:hypothetical protein
MLSAKVKRALEKGQVQRYYFGKMAENNDVVLNMKVSNFCPTYKHY